MTQGIGEVLAGASVQPEIWDDHASYRALLIVVDGLEGGPSDERSDALLSAAEQGAVEQLAGRGVEEIPEIQLWRNAFLSCGVKQRVARSSVEALVRRCAGGLPRVDRLTDLYNAVSVRHLVPLGGEDLDHYVGPPRLVVADGTEPFATMADGEAVESPPEAGEIVWRDDAGVTCRRWNWRQCLRTRLNVDTRRALFILDGLGDDAAARVAAAGDELLTGISSWWPQARTESRLLVPDTG